MAMEITNSYSSYVAQNMLGNTAASSTKKKETENTSETAGSSKSKSATDYESELAKLVPSVDFKVGNSFSTAKSGKTLTINPQLLEKMQNDPDKEKEIKELIKGVESATNLMDSIYKASGWTVVYRHSYIDENGKYCAMACVRNDFMLNLSDKLREERRKNSEELIEKTKEKVTEKEEKLEEILEEALEEKLEEKKEEETEEEDEEKTKEKSAYSKAEQLIEEKMAASKVGLIYLNDADIRTIIEVAEEDDAGKTTVKDQTQVGANLDLKIQRNRFVDEGVLRYEYYIVTNTSSGMGLMKCANVVISLDNTIEKGTDHYNLYNTNIHEKIAMQKKGRKAIDNSIEA